MDHAGASVSETAKVLQLSKNAVYKYLAEPCPSLASERAENLRRMITHRALYDTAPFCVPDDSSSTDNEARLIALRTQIGEMLDQGMRKADIARVLNITPQLLQYHIKLINEPATADGYSAGCAALTAATLFVYASVAMRYSGLLPPKTTPWFV
jgi:predicted transcriptional regulator